MIDLASVNDLTSFLKEQTETDQVLFEAEGDAIGRGYHLTELGLARSSSIDCGGVMDAWDEAQMQVLDAPGDKAMSVGKIIATLSRSVAEIDGLADAPLNVEFSPGNQGLGRYRIGQPRAADGAVTFPLTPMGPECKALTRAMPKPGAGARRQQPAAASGCC